LNLLLKKLQDVNAPCFQLDEEIMSACGCVQKDKRHPGGGKTEWWEYPNGERVRGTHVTHRIDDALALCNAVFNHPQWLLSYDMAEVNGYTALKRGAPAMALCHALVLAKHAGQVGETSGG